MQPPQPEPHPSPRLTAGFTLIESLVAIAIVGALIGITLVGVDRMREAAKSDQTRVLLQQLAGVETEYRAASGGEYPGDDPSVPTNTNAAVDTTIEWFLAQATQFPAVRDMLTQTVNANYYTAPDGTTPGLVVDSWDQPIEYRIASDGTTGVTVVEGTGTTTFIFPLSSTPFFASPGPDGLWGSYDAPGGEVDQSSPDDQAKDNVYSFEL